MVLKTAVFTAVKTQTERTDLWTQVDGVGGEGKGGTDGESSRETCTLPHIK